MTGLEFVQLFVTKDGKALKDRPSLGLIKTEIHEDVQRVYSTDRAYIMAMLETKEYPELIDNQLYTVENGLLPYPSNGYSLKEPFCSPPDYNRVRDMVLGELHKPWGTTDGDCWMDRLLTDLRSEGMWMEETFCNQVVKKINRSRELFRVYTAKEFVVLKKQFTDGKVTLMMLCKEDPAQ
jgi:hypothetical protein